MRLYYTKYKGTHDDDDDDVQPPKKRVSHKPIVMMLNKNLNNIIYYRYTCTHASYV